MLKSEIKIIPKKEYSFKNIFNFFINIFPYRFSYHIFQCVKYKSEEESLDLCMYFKYSLIISWICLECVFFSPGRIATDLWFRMPQPSYFFFLSSSKRRDKSSKSMSSSLLPPGASGKSDGTLGKLDKSSMCGGGAVADGGVGGVIFDLGCGFGVLFKFCFIEQKKTGEKERKRDKWSQFTYFYSNLHSFLLYFRLTNIWCIDYSGVGKNNNKNKKINSTWSTGRSPEIVE